MIKYTRSLKTLPPRLLALFLALCALLSLLTACTENGEIPPDESETDAESTAGASGSGITLNDIPLERFSVYYAWKNTQNEKASAEMICAAVEEAFGIRLPLSEEPLEPAANAIMVGDGDKCRAPLASADLNGTEYALTSDGANIYLIGAGEYGLRKAAEAFCDEVRKASPDGPLRIEAGEKRSYADELLSVMTFNIYNWDTSEEHLQRILDVIKENEMPDTIGFQEITQNWIDRILADTSLSAVYASVGQDRNDETHEQAAIFYRRDKFRLVEGGTRWLFGEEGGIGSEKPGKLRLSQYNRVYTYAVLERISDGKRFAHINTHLDLVESILPIQIDYALAMAKKIRDENGYPVVLTGDFNSKLSSEVGKKILDAGFVHTESAAAAVLGREVEDVYQGTSRKICSGIDHVFVLSESPFIESYTICDTKYRRGYASDHLPRIAILPI